MKRIEMGHAGHFILGHLCQFRRATYINGYIVSTVGELRTKVQKDRERMPYEPLFGFNETDLYETMVFHALKTGGSCGCPYVQQSGSNIFERRWKTSKEAQEQHERIVRMFSKRKSGLKKAERFP